MSVLINCFHLNGQALTFQSKNKKKSVLTELSRLELGVKGLILQNKNELFKAF